MTENNDLKVLEESLWLPQTRFDKSYMEKILHSDFFEFGRSGKTYTRAECIDTPRQKIDAKIPLDNFSLHIVNENTRLVTYTSEVGNSPPLRANRSSLWIKCSGSWKLRFHQGTPI